MPVPGAIADAARAFLPVTWDALDRDDRFGDGLLESKINLVKETLFGEVISVAAEDTYALRVINFSGKMVALELITPGIDFWMNELVTESTTGTNETNAWTDRAEALRKLGEKLAWEVRRDEPDILALLGKVKSRSLPRMDISTPADDELLTPNPRGFPRQFA